MNDKTVVETIIGKHHKYEIMKESHVIGSTKYYVYKDGKPYRGSFSSLRDAVEAAKNEG